MAPFRFSIDEPVSATDSVLIMSESGAKRKPRVAFLLWQLMIRHGGEIKLKVPSTATGWPAGYWLHVIP